MRSLRLTDGGGGGKGDSQVHDVSAMEEEETSPPPSLQAEHRKGRSAVTEPAPSSSSVSKLVDPALEPYFKPLDYVTTLACIHEQLELASQEEKSPLYLEQSFVFRGLSEMKLVRRSLRSARQFAVTVHEKLVYAAWLRHEKRDEDLNDGSSTYCNPCSCHSSTTDLSSSIPGSAPVSSSVSNDISFHIDGDIVHCNRQKMAALSIPFFAMLNGGFSESQIADIEFSENGITAVAMRAIDRFSKTGRLGHLSPDMLLEILSFSNRFCCEKLKDACDEGLTALVRNAQDVATFLDYGLEESAQALVAYCLKVFLRELPNSLWSMPHITNMLCAPEGRAKFEAVGHSSFALYSLLSQVSLEEDKKSALTVAFLEGQQDYATSRRQKALAVHQLGCIMLAKEQYVEAQGLFEAAVKEGHVYSSAGVLRAKHKQGLKATSYEEASRIISDYLLTPAGWMFQERSLYCDGNKKIVDLNKATELDPTLIYPYQYRAAALMDEQKVQAAVNEINRILGFKVTPDCLELRAYFCLALQEYEGAIRDVRALLTLNPKYMMFGGRVGAWQLLRLLSQHVEQWTKADCWMQLYDRWSSVDDIGSLAVVHQMLESDPGKGLLFFRQSLLLLRLNCPKAAMRSLRLAREHASSEYERLVYEGWILYDSGHREEALQKAEESICIHRSFEAFFLKAYALADTSLDPTSSDKVVELLEEALKCPSDGLRKGQALNNLGSVYVDCGKFELAADCYVSALKIRHTRAHQGLARVYALQGDRKSAHEEMTRLIEKARNNASAYEKRSEYCEREMTMVDLSMVTQLDPLRTYPYRYRAAVLMDAHKEREAIMELSKAIAFKADLQLLHLRAAFHECNEDFVGARRDCRAALSMDPSHLETLELHSRVHNQEP
ncbi:unnamed protein product [Sphagnum compactum]